MQSTHLEHFINRHEAIAFFKYLYEARSGISSEEGQLIERIEEVRGFPRAEVEAIARRQEGHRPVLPILTFLAPGGGGKSTLIHHLRDSASRRHGEVLFPYAHLDFTQADAPKDLFSILIALRNQLHHLRDTQGKRIIFPRFDLGAAAASVPPVGLARSYIENDLRDDLLLRVANRLKEEAQEHTVVEWYGRYSHCLLVHLCAR